MPRLVRLTVIAVSLMTLLAIAAPVAAQNKGCTPGFWKNHPEAWMGYAPSDLIGDVFTSAPQPYAGMTLIAGLDLQGGAGLTGATEVLLRAAIAGLLNRDFPASSFIATVNSTLESGTRKAMLRLASQLDAENNGECTRPDGDGGGGGTGQITIAAEWVTGACSDFRPDFFSYTTTGSGLSNFVLDGDGDGQEPTSVMFSGLAPGTYTVHTTQESVGCAPGAGISVNASCTAGGSVTRLPEVGAPGPGEFWDVTATITITGSEHVTCTFTYAQFGATTG